MTPLHIRLAHRLYLGLRDYLQSRGESPGVWGFRRTALDTAFRILHTDPAGAEAIRQALLHNDRGIEEDLVRLDLLIRRSAQKRDAARGVA